MKTEKLHGKILDIVKVQMEDRIVRVLAERPFEGFTGGREYSVTVDPVDVTIDLDLKLLP